MVADMNEGPRYSTLRRELLIWTYAFGFSFFGLPLSIYWVGQQVFGGYAGGGVLDLEEQVWGDLFALRATAWILVLSPYVVIQLGRLTLRLWRAGKVVNRVTNPDDQP